VESLTQPRRAAPETARQHVTALNQAHALGLVRLAVLMVGDQPTAEDVVQDAFLALYRRWPTLKDPDRALAYARASVLNGCRMVHRANSRHDGITLAAPDATESAPRPAPGNPPLRRRRATEVLRRPSTTHSEPGSPPWMLTQ
jgi:DNA-directed RNA polymerase specialized sigma24 family protein